MLDVLVLSLLPCLAGDRPAFQGGGPLHSLWLVTGLAQRGHRVRVITTRPPAQTNPRPVDPPPGVEVDWFAVDTLDMLSAPSAEAVAPRRAQFAAALERAIAAGRPDVVLLAAEFYSWFAIDPCRERGLPVVVGVQGPPTAAIPDGILAPADLERFAGHLRDADAVVTVSDFLAAILTGLGVSRPRTIVTATDRERFRPRPKDPELLAELRIDPGAPVVGSFAHFRQEKRVLDVIAAAETVLREHPDAVYVLVGDGPQRPEVAAAIARRGLGERFRLAGEVRHEELPRYMSACDVIVVASELEGYSLISREVQASGRALIVSDIPAGRAAARDGETAALFRTGDTGDLAAQTLRLIRDEPERRRLAARGREAVAEQGDGWIEEWADALASAAGAT